MPKIYELLQKYWGYDSFRPFQEQIITNILAGKDLLAFLPTGSGKSLCFQLPALCRTGLTLVVTPLISLMRDQVSQLAKRGIYAEAIFSGMSSKEIERRLDNCIYGAVKLLYVSPERLQTDLFKLRAANMNIITLVVDEAHCISQWGYDFRPSYLEIAHFKATIPQANIAAFTATATKAVSIDMQERLALTNPILFSQPFYRSNIVYWVRKTEDKEGQLCRALKQHPGSAIVYVNTRKRTQKVATLLDTKGITATFYHAGLTAADRIHKQEQWSQNKVRVIVATAAFGMGIDKPDVALVVHLDLPTSLEAYCQEVGRAGRDNHKAYAILWYDLHDIVLLRQRWKESYPTIDQVKKVYQHLVNYYKIAVGSHAFVTYDFDLEHFKNSTAIQAKEAYYGLKVLESEGFIQLNEAYYQPSKIYFLLSKQALYDFQLSYPAYDLLIRGLLRIYGGALFAPYCMIIEKKIAQQLSCMPSNVYEQLCTLHRLQVVEYLPQRMHPQITFLTPRYIAAQLPLKIDKIQQKNETARKKMEAVIHYITNHRLCRLVILLDYFGEKELTCHQCDICRQQVTEGMEVWRAYIIEAITTGKQALEELTAGVAQAKEKELLDAIRRMLETQEIYYHYPGKLQLR
ncbi:MAG: RecQ family ATP-dependent DNA helicase [Amoebophilaceae bacterium]|nr:RecQ family ATP-dependent DNA helicase [Amoebophilaceae bacterium]